MMPTMVNYPVEERQAWRRWVTPKPLQDKPIHRWYVFPHSFTSELVHALIEEWGLGPADYLLDPFAGAGTTLLAAKERGIPAVGYDLSPLAVLVTRAKIAHYSLPGLFRTWHRLKESLNPGRWTGPARNYPDLVQKALPNRVLAAFDAIDGNIAGLSGTETERCFFRTALLAILPRYSRAVATGGWLKWVASQADVADIPAALTGRVETMLADLQEVKFPRRSRWWRIGRADARQLPDPSSVYSAVITSPPYPNRHDYTRVFGIELMFGFLDWSELRKLRYQSFHSHPEARPERPAAKDYAPPAGLVRSVAEIRAKSNDPRVSRMIEGYFLDLYICLRELRRVCRPGAKVALVVGNAQYCGEPVLVDELTAEIGERAGLTCEKLLAVRYRGNSAQQMGIYGRNPSRESVVIFRNI
ncbi:MAG: site-specific DNA-methyltransferase [Armatimonadetes bacterium]|nr:site-specific DNA-methyltransferase [Armatimonadota bacterium]